MHSFRTEGAGATPRVGATEVVLRRLADCPRCGGWARQDERIERRYRCKGCHWTGLVAGA